MFCVYLSEKTVLMCHFVRKNTKNNCISTFFFTKKCIQSRLSAVILHFFSFTRAGPLEKNNKIRVFMESKVFGKELKVETGFDGQQEWQYIHHKDEDNEKSAARRDTLTITKSSQKPKNEHSIDFDIYKNYKTAKMKLDGQNYEITLTKPIKKAGKSILGYIGVNPDSIQFFGCLFDQVEYRIGYRKFTVLNQKIPD